VNLERRLAKIEARRAPRRPAWAGLLRAATDAELEQLERLAAAGDDAAMQPLLAAIGHRRAQA
jgi:putative heme iron utilization protein